MARTIEIEIQAGSAQSIYVSLSDRNGDPISSFVGWRARADVRYAPREDSPVLWVWDTEDESIQLVPGDESHALLKMPPPAVSLAWTWRLAWFDITTVDGNGDPAGLPVRGVIRVTPGVTRIPED